MARLAPDKGAAQFYGEELKGGLEDGKFTDVLAPKIKSKRAAEELSASEDLTASGSEGSDEQSEDSAGDTSSSSDGASDLEGIPLASDKLASESRPSRSELKRSKAGTAQKITEDGAASKIGIVFNRLLEKESSHGVLAGSKSVQKRRREDEAEAVQRKEAKLQRQALTSRNHKAVHPKGQDPAQDAREKTLMTLATKGVVQLFNALSKAQQARWHSEVQGEKPDKVVKASKAALLGVLKPSKPAEEAGWKVLQKGFTGFKESKMKMKDFDRQDSSDSDDAEDNEPAESMHDDDESESS